MLQVVGPAVGVGCVRWWLVVVIDTCSYNRYLLVHVAILAGERVTMLAVESTRCCV
jgi:hypothetical protein